MSIGIALGGSELLPFDPAQFVAQLELTAPPTRTADETFRQLRSIADHAHALGCQSVAIEPHYIDRDHIEDHSIFYSKSLFPYKNHCRRVHFFSREASAVRDEILSILADGIRKGKQFFRERCAKFSEATYLGFSVIRPLAGSPVGRTVLPYRHDAAFREVFCQHPYPSHLCGIELHVPGVAFQQQDVGVSACATTAIWSALQQFQAHEHIAHVTPAQITSLAARHSTPTGRIMPSEGLTSEQMCFALSSVGLAPNLFAVADHAPICRQVLNCSIKSRVAPILLLERVGDPSVAHAVTVVGLKMHARHAPLAVSTTDGTVFGDDLAGDLAALAVHDDRVGPYIHSELTIERSPNAGKPDKQHPILHLPEDRNKLPKAWRVTHVLVPTHQKIRLSPLELNRIALHVTAKAFHGLRCQDSKAQPLAFECWFDRSNRHLESLYLGQPSLDVQRVQQLYEHIRLPRYLGIVSLQAPAIGVIQMLVDMTSTLTNPHFSAVLLVRTASDRSRSIAKLLADEYRCGLLELG